MSRGARVAWVMGVLLGATVAHATPQCGETTCDAVTAAFISHFTGPGCTGTESYYTSYYADSVRRSWDGKGVAGTTMRTVTNMSYKDMTGTCFDAWPGGNTLSTFVTIYRCGAGTKVCGSECIPSSGCCVDGDCPAAPLCNTGVGTCTGNACHYTPLPDGASCEGDGDLCTVERCQAGVCATVGPKDCTPSSSCAVSACESSSGNCVDSPLPVGARCNGINPCVQDGICDATGGCSGVVIADGTPCSLSGCSSAASCSRGACICADGGADTGPGTQPAGATPAQKSGCAFAPTGDRPVALLLAVLALWLLRRTTARRA